MLNISLIDFVMIIFRIEVTRSRKKTNKDYIMRKRVGGVFMKKAADQAVCDLGEAYVPQRTATGQ